MVEDRVTDGRRIAELLASEVTGRRGDLAGVAVADADTDVEPTPDGAHSYDVRVTTAPDGDAGDGSDGRQVARVYVQPDRVRLELSVVPGRALELAEERGLRARPRATTPPAAVVFVESGAQTKRAADLLGLVAGHAGDGDGEEPA